MKKKVLFTGATGAIGQNLVPLFLENNYKIQAITRDLHKARQLSWYKDVEFFELDMCQELHKLDINPKVGLIHLAWQGLPNYKSEFHISENLPMNYNFIKSHNEFGKK